MNDAAIHAVSAHAIIAADLRHLPAILTRLRRRYAITDVTILPPDAAAMARYCVVAAMPPWCRDMRRGEMKCRQRGGAKDMRRR